MSSGDLATGLVSLSQTVVGVLENFSLLYHHIFLYITGCRLRSTDLILTHLIVGNSLFILTNGVPRTMAAFGLKDFLNDTGCKLLLYFRSVGRGVCIGSTCVLSIFQAITISPRNSRWAEIKVKAPNYIGLSISLCWLLYMLINIIFPVFMTGNWRNDTIIKRKNFGYCSSKFHNKITVSLYAALLSFPDALCLGLMLWASGSMVSILYRHKQRVQHIHRTSLSPRSSPESRATQTILLLLSIFVSFYALSCILQVCISLFDNPSLLLLQMNAIFAMCFPTVSPFVLMGRDSSVPGVSFSCRRNKNFPNSIRYM
ncbi:vomeronasal type-1 receptor 4-like [Choloepus didactylus]|uniref:vomeronasal type-1 receptor 4-like n=1 Tax=Choloepus didactylus TaxID=27675 RepID=UPI00189D25A4|nr:vomeronasal type-1 receptor 4-like [Choloepus didactylus]